MLNLWRRHLQSCPHRVRTYKKCSCPIWVQGTLRGTWMKRSLGVRNWEAAQTIVREWEAGVVREVKTVSLACEAFLKDCAARRLSDASLGKYRLLAGELTREFGDRSVASISLHDLRSYREGWDVSPISARKKIERLRTFFKFCIESEWTRENPAALVKPPQARPSPTLPFTAEEIAKIFRATEAYPNKGVYSFQSGKRIKAFVNLLQYSGLRIRDAVTLSKDRLDGNKLFLYTQKTGQPVWLPLPESVVRELHEVSPAGEYFFWSGNGLPKSAVADWQRSLARLFEIAGVKGHAHRFRDTFSVSLLKKGVPLETVSILLGHNSVRTTEKHYAPWVQSRQEALEEAVMKAWE